MIIFDLDGTLWNTVLATEKSFNDISKKYNLSNCDSTCVEKGMGLSTDEVLKLYFPSYSIEDAKKYLREISLNLDKYMNDENVVIYSCVSEMIKKLSGEYKLGIITNNTDNYIKNFLKISHLEEYFDDYIGASTYGITKKEAISKMVSKHSEKFNVYVGDIKKDMEAALGAGIEFIHAKYGFGMDFEYKYYINSFDELYDVVSCIIKNY